MPASSRFPTTRRSVIRATRSEDSGERRAAWEAVISAYWKPAYKYVRLRWQRMPEEAEDLVQGFFALALEKDYFAPYDPSRGTFRTWFRTCLDGYLSHQAAAWKREKRGGGRVEALDFASAEAELALAAGSTPPSPEECFHREWRRHLFALAVEDLRAWCEAEGKQVPFAVFRRYDLAEERSSYDALAAEFGIPATSVTNYLAAMRRQLRRAVLERLRATTVDAREFEREARALLGGS